jgi:hypothetical protein
LALRSSLLACVDRLALGQDIATKGAIGGKIADSTGAVVPNAKVTVAGPTGERVAIANEAGDFELTNLIPEIQRWRRRADSNRRLFPMSKSLLGRHHL